MRVLAGFAVIFLFFAAAFGSMALLGIAGGALAGLGLRAHPQTRGEKLAVGALGGLVAGWVAAMAVILAGNATDDAADVPVAYVSWVAALVGGALAQLLVTRRS